MPVQSSLQLLQRPSLPPTKGCLMPEISPPINAERERAASARIPEFRSLPKRSSLPKRRRKTGGAILAENGPRRAAVKLREDVPDPSNRTTISYVAAWCVPSSPRRGDGSRIQRD